MIRPSLALLFTLAICACRGDEKAIILDAEPKLTLPSEADPLQTYDRYYLLSNGIATGVFIESEDRKGSLRIVATKKDLPFVADGGCGVIDVRFDIRKNSWEQPFCHGP
jgi:hypothetical protein